MEISPSAWILGQFSKPLGCPAQTPHPVRLDRRSKGVRQSESLARRAGEPFLSERSHG